MRYEIEAKAKVDFETFVKIFPTLNTCSLDRKIDTYCKAKDSNTKIRLRELQVLALGEVLTAQTGWDLLKNNFERCSTVETLHFYTVKEKESKFNCEVNEEFEHQLRSSEFESIKASFKAFGIKTSFEKTKNCLSGKCKFGTEQLNVSFVSVGTKDVFVEVEALISEIEDIDRIAQNINHFFTVYGLEKDERSWKSIITEPENVCDSQKSQGITFKTFVEILQKIRDTKDDLDIAVSKYISSNPFVDDSNGIASHRLAKIIQLQVETLFIAVLGSKFDSQNENQVNALQTLIEYYLWEHNFGGKVTVGALDYDLENDTDLYKYVQIELATAFFKKA